jgi:hypothetical protein
MRLGPVALVLLAGCRTQLLSDLEDGGAPDAAACAPTVGGAPDAGACAGIYQLVAVPLTRLEFLDARPFAAAAVRVRVGFSWRPACDVLGDVDAVLRFDSGPDMTITAHVWRSSDAACTCPVEATAIVVISDTMPFTRSEIISIGDGAPGGKLLVGTTIEPPAPGSDCGAIALGGRCARDCQCRAALDAARCVPEELGAKGSWGICAVTCTEDAVCPDTAPGCATAMGPVPFICAAGDCNDASCPFGQSCRSFAAARACRPAAQAPTPPRSCSCSAECGVGGLCALVGEDALGCVLPCATDADCPGHHGGCGDLSCTAGRCIPNTC